MIRDKIILKIAAEEPRITGMDTNFFGKMIESKMIFSLCFLCLVPLGGESVEDGSLRNAKW